MIQPDRLSFRRALGIPLSVITAYGIVHFGGLTGDLPHVGDVRSHVRLWQLTPFPLLVAGISFVQRIFWERRMVGELRSLAESTAHFIDDSKAADVPPLGRRWQTRVQRIYVKQYGRRAARLLRRTPYGPMVEYFLQPKQSHDLKIAAPAILRAYEMSLNLGRRARWIKLCLRDVAIAGGLFFPVLGACRSALNSLN